MPCIADNVGRMDFRAPLRFLLPFLLYPACVGAVPVPQIPVEVFFSNPNFSQPKISPDGKQIAFVSSKGNTQTVFVRSVVGGRAMGLAKFPLDQVGLRWFDWANSERLVLSADAVNPSANRLLPRATRLYAVHHKRPRLKWLGEKWQAHGSSKARFSDRLISLLPRDRDNILISHLETGELTPAVSRMNVRSGRLRTIQRAMNGVGRWHADSKGDLRVGEAFGESSQEKGYRLLARASVKQEFSPVYESGDDSKSGYRFAGFHEKPNLLYVLADHKGRRALFEFDIKTRELGSLVFAHPKADITAAHFSEVHNKIVGAEYLADEPGIGFFDADTRREQQSIDLSLKSDQSSGTTNRIVSSTSDGELSIIESSSHVQAPIYYAYNRNKKEINFIFAQRPKLSRYPLAPVERINFKARDGLAISGYLTLPPYVVPAKLPLIVLLDGGPAARDAQTFDPAVQLFANRGFAVLQVNVRGSRSLGGEFRTAGDREPGEAIQSDIADGVYGAIERGIADPDRIGVFGANSGGYSAMMALVTTPSLYRAAASYGGIMNLEQATPPNGILLSNTGGQDSEGSSGEMSESEQRRRLSPLHRIAEIQAPVLLGHGARDLRVPVEHSQRMARALDASKKDVEYIEYDDDAHEFTLATSRIDFYERLVSFFDTHLPGLRPAEVAARSKTFAEFQAGKSPERRPWALADAKAKKLAEAKTLAASKAKTLAASKAKALAASKPESRRVYSRRVAVVVGIDQYKHWPALQGARTDGRNVAQRFREIGFDDVTEIYDRQASRTGILTALGSTLRDRTDPESLAVIYFAGHGQTETMRDGSNRGYIIPYDGDMSNVFATAISMDTLRDVSSRLPAKHIYYAMDSCYSGTGFTRGLASLTSKDGYISKVTSRRVVQMITAGSDGEQAYEIGGAGAFTSQFLRALSGEADFNTDGYVTSSEIGAFVKPQVTRDTRGRQTPQFGTLDGFGEVVFGVSPR